MTKAEIMKEAARIKEEVKKIGTLEAYGKNYEIESHSFKTMTEQAIEDKTSCWFCNALNKGKINSATLVFAATDGVIAIVPNSLEENEPAYFNLENGEAGETEILKIWKLIKTF